MKTWITLGLVKKRVNKKCKLFYVLRKGKSITKRSIFRNSPPNVIKDFMDRKLKNPLTQNIHFLHGMHQVLNMAARYCREFIVREIVEYCGACNTYDLRRLKYAVMSQKIKLCDLDDFVQRIHARGCKKEDLGKRTEHFLKDPDISSCPCRNPIYCHYESKMENCLTKKYVAFSSKYLKFRPTQRLRNKRTFFLTLQKCFDSLSLSNSKQY